MISRSAESGTTFPMAGLGFAAGRAAGRGLTAALGFAAAGRGRDAAGAGLDGTVLGDAAGTGA
ncbi:MAG TPA: hypothetical protein VHN99_11320, partial [Deinococcales bacterium]|nr:hypothetical protein [Deinococcales bacterium]